VISTQELQPEPACRTGYQTHLAQALESVMDAYLPRHCFAVPSIGQFGNVPTSLESMWETDIDYADDEVLFTSNQDSWSDLLCNNEAAASSVGLQTNWLKTKLQNIGSGSKPRSSFSGRTDC
jgi:hypothetical protein